MAQSSLASRLNNLLGPQSKAQNFAQEAGRLLGPAQEAKADTLYTKNVYDPILDPVTGAVTGSRVDRRGIANQLLGEEKPNNVPYIKNAYYPGPADKGYRDAAYIGDPIYNLTDRKVDWEQTGPAFLIDNIGLGGPLLNPAGTLAAAALRRRYPGKFTEQYQSKPDLELGLLLKSRMDVLKAKVAATDTHLAGQEDYMTGPMWEGLENKYPRPKFKEQPGGVYKQSQLDALREMLFPNKEGVAERNQVQDYRKKRIDAIQKSLNYDWSASSPTGNPHTQYQNPALKQIPYQLREGQ